MSNVKQGSITRFEGLTNQGLKVHIFGPLSHRAGQLTPNNNIEVTKNAKTPHNIIYARCSADDKFFTVKQGSNTLEILDLAQRRVVTTLKGYSEKPYIFDKFRSLRYAKEDQFPLWRRGQDSIVLLNHKTLQPVAEYRRFWPKGYNPIFMNICPPQKKIFGYSLSQDGGVVSVLSNYTQPSNSKTDFIKIPANQTWAGMEQNTDSSLTIVAIQNKVARKASFMSMVAYDTKQLKLSPLVRQDFKERRFKAVQFMRKIKGYDIFALACRNNMAIIGYSRGKFHVLNYLDQIYNAMIFEISIYGNFMIPVSTGENENIKVIEFGTDNLQAMMKSIQQVPNGVMSKKSRLLEYVFSNQKVKKITLAGLSGRKKISISPDGRTLYIGGDGGLAILKRQTIGKEFQLIRQNKQLSIYGIRGTPSGHFVIQCQGSNNLKVFDKKQKQVMEFKGLDQDVGFDSHSFKEPHFSFEGKQMIWFGSKTDLYTVDLTSLAQVKIENFIAKELAPNPLHCIADFSKEKFLVHYEITGNEHCLTYSEKGREPDVHICSDILPKYNEIKCMDMSKNKLFGFIGGWSQNEDELSGKQYSRGIVSAMKFEKSLTLLAEIELPKRKCSVVTKVIVSPTHDDVLFVATDGPLFILRFNPPKNQFDVLKAINLKTEKCKPIFQFLFC